MSALPFSLRRFGFVLGFLALHAAQAQSPASGPAPAASGAAEEVKFTQAQIKAMGIETVRPQAVAAGAAIKQGAGAGITGAGSSSMA